MNAQESPSTRPYLIRALYEWCTDNGFTPYVAVAVDESVQVPREFVKDGEIVLNVSYDATSGLNIGNDFLAFKARFGGVPREILVPIERVMAIYARENGQGMAFPIAETPSQPKADAKPVLSDSSADERVVQLVSVDEASAPSVETPPEPPKPASPAGARPALKRIK